MQRLLNRFYELRTCVMNCIMFLSVRLYGFEYTFDQVKTRRSESNANYILNLDNAKDLDTLLASAKDCFKDAIDRRSFVTDKAKTLITLNSALLAILTAFLPKSTEFDLGWMKLPFYVGVISIINALIMMWMYFDINKTIYIAVDQHEVELDKDNLKKSMINSYRLSHMSMHSATDFLVDLYVTARFFFLLGFLTIFCIFLATYVLVSPSTDTKKIIQQLRSESNLLELLKGPKGDKGEKGPVGETGPQGEKGERGLQGEKGERGAQVDKDDKALPRSKPN